MNKRALLIGSLIAVPLFVLLGLGFRWEDDTLVLRHDPNIVKSPLLGRPATPFVLDGFDGNVIGLEDLRGKPIVLNFWASWCQPCIYETPLLVAAAARYGERVHFIGVVPPEDTPEAVAAFQRRFGDWGPALYDRNGKVGIAYGVVKLPETYLIDADGIIQEKVAGALQPEPLHQSLENLL